MNEPDPTILHLNCPHCGGPVTLQYADWEGDWKPSKYPCPWCEKEHEFQSPGRFLWVTKGHHLERPKAV